MLDSWAQDLGAIALVLAAAAWLVTRWLGRGPQRVCSGCPRPTTGGKPRAPAGVRPKRLTVLR